MMLRLPNLDELNPRIKPGIGNASKIVEGLWVGAFPPPGLKSERWRHLVLCAVELQMPAMYWPAMHVHHCPLDDSEAPTTLTEHKRSVEMADRVAQWLSRGQGVLATCAQGKNRSALVAALAIMRMGWAADKAILRIRQVRGPEALSRPEFLSIIRQEGRRPRRVQTTAS